MKQINITTTFYRYESIEELSQEEKALIFKALESVNNAYAPYSNFKVGAAILLENGTMVTGNNQENIAYPSGLCAERVALFSASAQYPEQKIKMIALAAQSLKNDFKNPVYPCGACRQVFTEYEKRQKKPIKILMYGQSGVIEVVESSKSLLPLHFEAEF